MASISGSPSRRPCSELQLQMNRAFERLDGRQRKLVVRLAQALAGQDAAPSEDEAA